MIPVTQKLWGYPKKTEITDIKIIPILGDTTATRCSTKWQVYKKTSIARKRQGFDEDKKPILIDYQENRYTLIDEGNLDINEKQYAQWGADNAYLENIVLMELGLERLVL